MNPLSANHAVFAQAGWFYEMGADYRFVLTMTAIICITVVIIAVVAIVSAVIHSMHRDRMQAELKRDMVDRGMSGEDISLVIESRPPEGFLDRWAANQRKKSMKAPGRKEAAT
jgi:hypothetical protein